jgi:hypothetical protein
MSGAEQQKGAVWGLLQLARNAAECRIQLRA